jgi:segregation and condensation protein B
MNDEERSDDRRAPEAPEREKLDLAAVARELAARSREPSGDPAVEEQSGLPPAEPQAEAGGAGEGGGDSGDAVAEQEREAEQEERAEPEAESSAAPGPDLAIGEHQLSGAEIYAAVEALLFAADRPVTAAQIARALPRGVNTREVRKQLKAIRDELEPGQRGYELREIAGGWQLLTRQRFADYVIKLRKTAGPRKLSGSALETLAVVAYKQPVNRAEIERIRGVACGDMLRSLMEKRLVRITGRSQDLGNPLLYGTTREFLDHFGLGAIGDLPRSSELGRKPARSVSPPAGAGGQEDARTDEDGGGEQGSAVQGAAGADGVAGGEAAAGAAEDLRDAERRQA